MSEAAQDVLELRAKIAEAMEYALESYRTEPHDSDMPNFHFRLGGVVGLTHRLMDANYQLTAERAANLKKVVSQ